MVYTNDLMFNDSLCIKQKKKGYRFSADPLILANLIKKPSGRDIAEFGTGCGIIPLILCRRFSDLKIKAYEIQGDLAEIAAENMEKNRYSDRVKVIRSDIKSVSFKGYFDCVISNPPYIKKGAGRLNPDSEAAVARHEITITLDELLEKASEALKPGGKFSVIYPVLRMGEMKKTCSDKGLNPANLTMIHSKPERKAELFIMESIKGGKGGLKVEKPFYIYDKSGNYSEKMNSINNGGIL